MSNDNQDVMDLMNRVAQLENQLEASVSEIYEKRDGFEVRAEELESEVIHLKAEVIRLEAQVESLTYFGNAQLNLVQGWKAEVKRLKEAMAREAKDIEQTLGKVLGYPWYKDDPLNFPGATWQDGVCVGEHVPASLAADAADLITRLRK